MLPPADEEKTAEVMRLPQQSPHVSHMKAPALLTSGKKAVTEDRRGREGEAPERAFSCSLEDYGPGAVCKDAPARLQLPSLLGGRRCPQLSEESAREDGGCHPGTCPPAAAASFSADKPRRAETDPLLRGRQGLTVLR